MKKIISLRQTDRPVREKHKLNLDTPSYNQVTLVVKTQHSLAQKLGIVSLII